MVHKMLPYQDRKVIEKLHALRNLPPGTILPEVQNKEAKKLLDGILQFKNGYDDEYLLKGKLSEDIARVAMFSSLRKICRVCKSIIIASLKVPIPTYYRQMLGGLLDLSKDDLIFQELENLENLELSNTLLWQMQLLAQQTSTLPSPFQAHNENDQFLADLLRLPPTVDSLNWLQETHPEIAVRLALSYLLDYFSINRQILAVQPTKHTIRINKPFHFSNSVDMVIKSISLKEDGFLVHVVLNIAKHKLSFQGTVIPSSFVWRGFDSVIDNLGYSYLTWIENLHTGDSHFHKYQEQLTMAFYPAIEMNAKELTFSSHPMVIEASTVSQEGNYISLPDIVLEDFQWHTFI
jgi:hypothetical protein